MWGDGMAGLQLRLIKTGRVVVVVVWVGQQKIFRNWVTREDTGIVVVHELGERLEA